MQYIPAKTLIARTKPTSYWFNFDYNMNIYRGCNHGCIYCDSRSDCYHIEDFDTVRAKADSLALIERDLKSKRQTGVVGTGAMSDPYNPYERQYELTRGALHLFDKYGFGVSIATKSNLVVRDIDILQQIAKHSPVLIKMTITTFDDALCQKLEPHVVPSSKRFEALQALSEAGIFCGILLMPILPFINDSEENILAIVEAGARAGVNFIYGGFGVTLRENQRAYYYEQLDRLFPGLAVQYIRCYGERYSCGSPNGAKLQRVFEAACKKHGIIYNIHEINKLYRAGYNREQTQLF